MNKIFYKDALEGLLNYPKKSVDLIITSPPYNLGNTHHTGNNYHQAYGDNMNEAYYQKWQMEILNACYEVLKDNGSMFYNHKNRIKDGVQISPYEWIFKSKFIPKQELVWFNGSQNFDKIRFYPMTERVYWLVKDPSTKLINNINHHDFFNKSEWQPVGTKSGHTRQFPERMVEDILKCFPDSKIVMDCFMGSGTTAVVAKRMGKEYVGFETNKDYCAIADKRLNEQLV